MKNFLFAFSFLVCILIIAFQRKRIMQIENEDHTNKLQIRYIPQDSIIASCSHCGQVQTIYLYNFNEDTVTNQKLRKKAKYESYRRH